VAGLVPAAARATIGPTVSGWMLMGGTSTIGRRRTGDAPVRLLGAWNVDRWDVSVTCTLLGPEGSAPLGWYCGSGAAGWVWPSDFGRLQLVWGGPGVPTVC
jgi:hypothetical protein